MQDTIEMADEPTVVAWSEFLQEHPPGNVVTVSGATGRSHSGSIVLMAPELQLHCPEQTCNALMFFTSEDGGDRLSHEHWKWVFMTYWCRNCQKYTKVFALAVTLKNNGMCDAFKFGEFPPFGPPVPARVLRLIQSDRELFLRGRRCEDQGLGIGAFAYYRRVVENQWTRLVDEIIKVAKRIGAPQSTLDALASARSEQQFSKAIQEVKAAIPPVLLINDHNPLMLLHSALSQGVHNLPDEECLTRATSIRVVLVELAEKLGQALRDEKELNDAVSQLLRAHESRRSKDGEARS